MAKLIALCWNNREINNDMMTKSDRFGQLVWQQLQQRPFGSITKRELELNLLQAAVEAGLLQAKPTELATMGRISLTRAHSYLNDLALRQPPLDDREAMQQLIGLLKNAEVVQSQRYFSLPLHDAALRIWLERKCAELEISQRSRAQGSHKTNDTRH